MLRKGRPRGHALPSRIIDPDERQCRQTKRQQARGVTLLEDWSNRVRPLRSLHSLFRAQSTSKGRGVCCAPCPTRLRDVTYRCSSIRAPAWRGRLHSMPPCCLYRTPHRRPDAENNDLPCFRSQSRQLFPEKLTMIAAFAAPKPPTAKGWGPDQQLGQLKGLLPQA